MDDELNSHFEIPLLFGRYLVLRGAISEADLAFALDFQKDLLGNLACTALETEMIGLPEWLRCREYQRNHGVVFEQAATALGYVDDRQVAALYRQLDQNRVPVGEVLVKQGKLTAQQLAELLGNFEKNGAL
ncbi:MAG: hypothetical protein FIA97_14170 [Methylococcaceae bacterium]|nr:hypothetical protein [Methylococcaceae bacterium]